MSLQWARRGSLPRALSERRTGASFRVLHWASLATERSHFFYTQPMMYSIGAFEAGCVPSLVDIFTSQ